MSCSAPAPVVDRRLGHPSRTCDKPASVIGDPDMPHTYTFIPDIGENLVALGERDDALGRAWHLPSPETRTTREVIGLVYVGVASV
jgi:nucleoside-diphosphate-sugar epimerase